MEDLAITSDDPEPEPEKSVSLMTAEVSSRTTMRQRLRGINPSCALQSAGFGRD
jgi:hypothetical protein